MLFVSSLLRFERFDLGTSVQTLTYYFWMYKYIFGGYYIERKEKERVDRTVK